MVEASPPKARATFTPDSVREAVVAAFPGWLVARVLVVGALVLAHYLVDELDVRDALVRATVRSGLNAWDGQYYVDITEHGYSALPDNALRFFPLMPMLAKPFTWVGIPARVAVVGVGNAFALGAGALLFHLARVEGRDESLATRAAWLLALAPSAFVLVLGYADAAALALALGVFVALRRERWWWAVGLGVLAGLARPAALLLAAPALIEIARTWRFAEVKDRIVRVAAVIAAPLGTGLYLLYVGVEFGDPLLPYRVQTRSGFRGSFANPIDTVHESFVGLFRGDAVGTGLHVPWLILAIALVVVCFRILPASYGVYATLILGAALVSSSLDAFERYALGGFPLVLTVAALTESRRVERAVLVTSGSVMTVYALLAFLHAYVP